MSTVTEPTAPPTARHRATAPSTLHSFLAVVARGLRDARRAPLVWGGSLGAMTALMAAIWPSISGSMTELMQHYPANLKEAFGITELDSAERYIDAEMLNLIVPLALATFAIRQTTRPTVGAEDRGYLDTLLALPLSRTVLVLASFAVTGVVLLGILAVAWVITMTAAAVAGAGLSGAALARGLVNIVPLAMAFGGLAAFAGGLSGRPGTVTGAATGVMVGMYVLDLAGKLAPAVESLRPLSAFRWYGSAIQHGLDATHMLALGGIGTALAVAGAWLFERRDVG